LLKSGIDGLISGLLKERMVLGRILSLPVGLYFDDAGGGVVSVDDGAESAIDDCGRSSRKEITNRQVRAERRRAR
jgi:hypothetical protein